MFLDFGVGQLAPKRLQRGKRPFLVDAHEPAETATSAARMAASLRSTRSVAKAVSHRTGRMDHRLSRILRVNARADIPFR
jgi:hypothetical protein